MSTERLQLLVLDDEAAHIEFIRGAFEDAGSKVDIHAVSTLREYRERVAAHPPDIALVDMNLPDGRGMELLSQNAPFPVLLMTAYGSQEIAVEVMKAGALDYIVKSSKAFATIPHNVESALREWNQLQHHRNTERELREKDFIFLESQRLGHIGTWFYKMTGQIVWSDEAYHLYGVSPATFSPTPESLLSLIHPVDRPLMRAWITDCVAGKNPGTLEYRITLPDGTTRFLYGTGQLVTGDGSTYIAGTVQDITERKRVEEQRVQSEARLTEAQEVAKIGSWETLLADFSVQWSDETFRIFEVSKADFHPTHPGFISLIHPEDRAKVAAAFTGSIGSKNQSNSIEHRIVTPSGIKFVEERWRIFCDEQGRPVRIAGVCHDITERKQAEERYRILFNSIQDGVALAEAESETLIDCNDALCRLVGRRKDELIGLNQTVLHPAGTNPGDASASFKAHKEGSPDVALEDVLLSKNGKLIPVEIRASRLQLEGRDMLLGIFRNITERKQAEKKQGEMQSQLQQSQKMESIGLLAGGVAHDFNNILTAIKGYCALVTNTLKPEDPNREDMGEIMTAADRASTLTRQLLAFSRKQVLSPKIIDLNKALGDIVNMLRRIIGEEIKLSIKLHPAPCFANVDPGQIEQIIMNLALNARDAISKGGEITLETESLIPSDKFFAARPDLPRGPMVCIKVRDNGRGMSPEEQTHLFEPFYTTKAQGKGTGLGLPMVFGIVKQSLGGIEVESEPGKGSVFMVYFPLSEAPLQDKDKDKDKEPSLKGHEIVLLVEDEDSLRRLGERILIAGGYTVLVAADGKAALKLMEERGSPVDLLMTDLVMPGMSGRELAAELARRKLTPRTLYMSGYTDDAIAKHGILESGIAFIYKPFSVEALSLKLREVLDGPADQAKA